MDVDVDVISKDEIGQLAKVFKNLIASTRGQALVAERLAGADLTVDVEVRSEKDVLGKSMAQLVNDLNEIMANIASASEQVAAGIADICFKHGSFARGYRAGQFD